METEPQTLNIPLNARCQGCGYLLRDLPEPRCPECGRTFDPADRSSMNLPQYRPRSVRTFGGQMIAAAVCALCFAILGRTPNFPTSLWHFLVAIIWAGMLLAWLNRRVNGNAPNRLQEGPENWRRVVKVFLLLSALLCVRIVNCYHTTSIGFGPIGLSFGGRPCNNPPHDGGIHLFGPVFLTCFRDIP